MKRLGIRVPDDTQEWWEKLGLEDYNKYRTITRLEAAVVIDAAFDPFSMFNVDYNGSFTR